MYLEFESSESNNTPNPDQSRLDSSGVLFPYENIKISDMDGLIILGGSSFQKFSLNMSLILYQKLKINTHCSFPDSFHPIAGLHM